MSSGQKDAYERDEEKRFYVRRDKLKADPNEVLNRIETARDALTRFIASAPALTRKQHAWIEKAAEELELLP